MADTSLYVRPQAWRYASRLPQFHVSIDLRAFNLLRAFGTVSESIDRACALPCRLSDWWNIWPRLIHWTEEQVSGEKKRCRLLAKACWKAFEILSIWTQLPFSSRIEQAAFWLPSEDFVPVKYGDKVDDGIYIYIGTSQNKHLSDVTEMHSLATVR
jgi:hypothetical protein